MTLAFYFLTALAAIVLLVLWRRQAERRRQQRLSRLMDSADELERLLHRIRDRMRSMREVVDRVPEEVGADARASLNRDPQVQDALRDLLEHRLWIQQRGQQASARELREARTALDRARERIAGELARLERAGAELAEITDAAAEAARREPPSLRRRDA